MTPRPSEILRRAAQVAGSVDHLKGNTRTRSPAGEVNACCAVGAIITADELLRVGQPPFKYGGDPCVIASRFLHAALPPPPWPHEMMTVPAWNDRPETTRDNVVAALTRAAEAAEAAGQ